MDLDPEQLADAILAHAPPGGLGHLTREQIASQIRSLGGVPPGLNAEALGHLNAEAFVEAGLMGPDPRTPPPALDPTQNMAGKGTADKAAALPVLPDTVWYLVVKQEYSQEDRAQGCPGCRIMACVEVKQRQEESKKKKKKNNKKKSRKKKLKDRLPQTGAAVPGVTPDMLAEEPLYEHDVARAEQLFGLTRALLLAPWEDSGFEGHVRHALRLLVQACTHPGIAEGFTAPHVRAHLTPGRPEFVLVGNKELRDALRREAPASLEVQFEVAPRHLRMSVERGRELENAHNDRELRKAGQKQWYDFLTPEQRDHVPVEWFHGSTPPAEGSGWRPRDHWGWRATLEEAVRGGDSSAVTSLWNTHGAAAAEFVNVRLLCINYVDKRGDLKTMRQLLMNKHP